MFVLLFEEIDLMWAILGTEVTQTEPAWIGWFSLIG